MPRMLYRLTHHNNIAIDGRTIVYDRFCSAGEMAKMNKHDNIQVCI